MIIKELQLNNDTDGVLAVSLVPNPAIEENFLFFSKEIKEFGRISKGNAGTVKYKYTAYPEPEVIETSHPFCKEHAGRTFTEEEVKSWAQLKKETPGFIPDSDFLDTFPNNGYNLNSAIFNCRHNLVKVVTYSTNFSSEVNFEIENAEKQEISGMALVSNKMIYRTNINGTGQDGYVYFSRDTVRKLKDKYGYNRTVTLNHEDNITGTLILLDSWLVEDEQTKWFLKYKVISKKLWDLIKEKKVVGFSIEVLVS